LTGHVAIICWKRMDPHPYPPLGKGRRGHTIFVLRVDPHPYPPLGKGRVLELNRKALIADESEHPDSRYVGKPGQQT
jgi:hypothetical protein